MANLSSGGIPAGVYRTLRPLLFRLAPETAHQLTVNLLRLAGGLPPVRSFLRKIFAVPLVPVEVFGLHFNNPVGLAAGYDKDGLAWRGLACLGFGHLELGTVTLRPQSGSQKPRVFRLVEDEAVINRMGFPGKGADFLQARLNVRAHHGPVIGVNLGKNKDTPLEQASEDYLELVRRFAPLAGYLAINVSSPNTVGLRRLQAREYLLDLLSALDQERRVQSALLKRRVPLLVKLAPDLNDSELDDALEAVLAADMDGVIAANTTIQRPSSLRSPHAKETGGLSGAPLTKSSTEIVRAIVQRTLGNLPVIATGGIMDGTHARQKLDAGAVLVQLYTGMIYAGPSLAANIVRSLST